MVFSSVCSRNNCQSTTTIELHSDDERTPVDGGLLVGLGVRVGLDRARLAAEDSVESGSNCDNTKQSRRLASLFAGWLSELMRRGEEGRGGARR